VGLSHAAGLCAATMWVWSIGALDCFVAGAPARWYLWRMTQTTVGPPSILLIANRTAATQTLLDAVSRRADLGDVRFHLVLPAIPRGLHRLVDPEVSGRAEAHERLQAALPHLSAAAGTEVTGEVGDADPMAALHDALYQRSFDEIIVSTLPRRVSRWLRLDLPSKARGLGLPVTLVEAEGVLGKAEPSTAGAAVA